MVEVSFLPNASSLPWEPWKNGGGRTRELLLWPRGATFEEDGFDVRISLAKIEQPGPFSTLFGCKRLLTVVGGDGLFLDHGDEAPRTRVRPLEPYPFQGDWRTSAELVGSSVLALNVMTRRGSVRATVDVLRLGVRTTREALECDQAFLHVLAGSVTARVTDEEDPFELDAGDSLWLHELRGGEELFLEGLEQGSELVWVGIERDTARA